MTDTNALPVDFARFVEERTAIASPPLLPEIKLHLANEVPDLWKATELALNSTHVPPPYWAFAWPGGQAVARYILDHPEWVRGKRVLDMASGSGMCAIAAMKAGAKKVTAVDIDLIALAAMEKNARLNDVSITIRSGIDIHKAPWWTDVIIAGDVCYEQPMATHMIHWLRLCCEKGITVLLGDPGRIYVPQDGLKRLQDYKVPALREIEDSDVRAAAVYQLFIPKG
ncbi:MAG: methyltransferase [Alphaproteobacteria bacterium]|nr:methyltransferase [Alphaproteobacteria bacterium]MBV8548497.1 methyltransferase [Alphaproteobacteria bacterium]